MTAREWLGQAERIAGAATEGPWTSDNYVDIDRAGTYDLAHITAPDPDDPDTVLGVALGVLRADGEFMAKARTLLPQATNALCAVLDLHEPKSIYPLTFEGFVDGDADPILDFCPTCTDSAVVADIEDAEWSEEVAGTVEWPCPTVRAITEALEVTR